LLALAAATCSPQRSGGPGGAGGAGHEKGEAGAGIVLIEYVDFACSACATFARETLPHIEREWVDSGRLRIRLIPFDALRLGRDAARAALCAGEQDAFWPMHDRIFARREEWLGRIGQRAIFEDFAAALHLDEASFRACWTSERPRQSIDRNNALARRHGVPGTPAFTVNGRPIVGALPYAGFARLLEDAYRARPTPSRGSAVVRPSS
jgi:protein-disulfide isomerase